MEDFDTIDIDLTGPSTITDPAGLFVQEVTLAIKMAPFDAWGCYDGVDLQKYVFNQYITSNAIKNELMTFINEHCQHSTMFNWDIICTMMKVEDKELVYIEMSIDVDNAEPLKVKFLLGSEL